MITEMLIVLVLLAFAVGVWIGAILMAKQYNANADKVHGICRFGKPVKVIDLDFYTSNLSTMYMQWKSIVSKGRQLKPGELTQGIATEGRMANIQGDNRAQMCGGHPLHGVPERPDVHPMGGGELPIQGSPRGGDVQAGS